MSDTALGTTVTREPPIGVASVVTGPDQIRRPIDRYLPNAGQLVSIERNRIRRINDCLSARGEHHPLREGPDLEAFAASLVRDRVVRSDLYGFFDPTDPDRYGYTNPPTIPATYSDFPPPSLSFEALAGCGDVADRHARGLSLTMESDLLPGGGPAIPSRGGRFADVAARWSACMATLGLAYPDPVAAVADVRWRTELTGPSQAQRATAAADLTCKRRTNLVGIAVTVQQAYDLAYIAEHQVALEAFLARLPKPAA